MNMSPLRLRWLYLRGPFWWMGLGSVLCSMVLYLVGFLIWQSEEGFQKHAVQTMAKVRSKTQEHVQKGNKGREIAYMLLYTFSDAAGQPHEGNVRASHQDWQRAKPGDTLAIEYDSTNPETSRRAGTEAHVDWGLWILGGIGSIFAAMGISLAAIAFVNARARARLIQYGTPALGIAGEVVENDAALKVSGTYRLLYNFTDASGQTREGRGPAQPWSLAARWDPGETILVLYDPDNPSRNEADVFEARNEDLDMLQDQVAGRK
jgi:hypothetical protein